MTATIKTIEVKVGKLQIGQIVVTDSGRQYTVESAPVAMQQGRVRVDCSGGWSINQHKVNTVRVLVK